MNSIQLVSQWVVMLLSLIWLLSNRPWNSPAKTKLTSCKIFLKKLNYIFCDCFGGSCFFFYLNKKTTRETTLASRFPLEEVETSGAAKTSLFFNVFLNSLLGGKIGASDGSTLLTEYKQKPVASVCFFHLASALLLLLSLLSEGNKKKHFYIDTHVNSI